MKRFLWIGLTFLFLVIAGWFLYTQESVVEEFVGRGSGFVFDEDTGGFETYKELKDGCPFKDCIEAIDKPRFESLKEADGWLGEMDVVFGIDYEGVQRAYPQKILNWHEIVNDQVGDRGVVISFCPLTGSVVGFNTKDHFGVSGKLRNSNLVMYDEKHGSLWQQITGKAIVGERFGEELEFLQVNVLRWKDWMSLYPQGEVLSRSTGFIREYDKYPYDNYEEVEDLYFPVEVEARYEIHPKTVVYGLEINGESKAYTWEALREETREDGVLLDTVGGSRIRISLSEGEVLVENMSRRSSEVVRRMFWFGWKAFYPDTELLK